MKPNNLFTCSRLVAVAATTLFLAFSGNVARAQVMKNLTIDFDLTAKVTATSDPCVSYVFESGTARSDQLGDFTWVSESADNFCSRGQGKGDHMAVSTFTDADGDKIYAIYHTVIKASGPTDLDWKGTWKFVGGTGKYVNIRGGGKVPSSGVQNVAGPFKCKFKGKFSI